VPSAPPGTIFVVGPEGGYAVPPRRYTLLFGRDREDVHVPIGVNDPAVSRRQGFFICSGPDGAWWLRNTGLLPIELIDRTLVLAGHKREVEPGYTPLVIRSSKQRSHLLEIRLVGGDDHTDSAYPDSIYELSPDERLVLTALAQHYLEGQDRFPLPVSWDEVARLVTASRYSTKRWTNRTAANVVEDVRERLHRRGVRGMRRDEVGEPVGSMLNDNLIHELIKTGTLVPPDLELLAVAGEQPE
jgi:hypothetical protein